MLGYIYEETTKYMKNEGKDVRKKKGQFFTPVNIAAYMGKWTMAKEHLDILDAGAGSGILTAGIIEHLLTIDGCRSIKVTFVENDPIILPLLKKNADYIQNICENHNIIFRYTIWSDSFFAIDISQKYDIVISNPPYKKIAKNSKEAIAMKDYVYGQPNLYGLFMAKGLELLKEDGQYIYITPRSWVSGLYYTEVRKAILKTDIEKIHIFSDRDTVFSGEQVLQETMILFGKKEKEQIEKIEINVSSDSYMQLEKTLSVPADLIKSVGEESYLLIPTNEDDIRIIRDMSNITDTFDSLGYQFKTGPVVEFRAKEMISEDSESTKMPDIVLYDRKHKRIIFIEAYSSTGEFNIDRVEEIKKCCHCGSDIEVSFITAFATTKKMLSVYPKIAWDTEIWVEEDKTHMTHKNGDKYLGRKL